MARRRKIHPTRPAWPALALCLLACERAAPPPHPVNEARQAAKAPFSTMPALPSAEVAARIRVLLGQSGPGVVGSLEDRTALARIYPAGVEPLLWLDNDLRPDEIAREALTALNEAASEGLDPGDYRGEALARLAEALTRTDPPSPGDIAAFDVGLSLSLMRYLRQMHRGRVDPRAIGFRLDLPEDEHDYAALVRDAAVRSGVRETIAFLAPPVVQYRLLRSMLRRYRGLARAEGATLPQLPARPVESLKPGNRWTGLGPLRLRLIALGDLPATAPPLANPAVYEGELVLGVRRFQLRHGLEADGVLGENTWAMLTTPLQWRCRQIELAMERMRWLPHLGSRPFLAVNIPMFRLWGWDRVPETGEPLFEMGVIVGRALNTRTPVFLEEMEYLIFQPYWNVPKSILRNEILPEIRRDLGYLSRQGMEIVKGEGDDATPVPPTGENVDLLAAGTLRLRQRPGPRNALGAVKFMFPNDANVYLHSTPAPELFGRARRDFSHGCVRVEDPVRLAEWALSDQPTWTRERILSAMKGAPSQRVALTRPIRVLLYYVTAAVMPQDGTIHFAADIYNHDPPLDQALGPRPPLE